MHSNYEASGLGRLLRKFQIRSLLPCGRYIPLHDLLAMSSMTMLFARSGKLELISGLTRGKPEYGRSPIVEQVELGAEAGIFLFKVVSLRLD